MRFRSELPIHASYTKITHKKAIFLVGSCFSSSIGQKLKENKFDTLINPFGTLYHPIPILNNLEALVRPKEIRDDLITQVDQRYVYFDMHSAIHANSREKLIDNIHHVRDISKEFIAKASYVFITLGSSFYFHHKVFNHSVANCHKKNNALFDRHLSSVSDLSTTLMTIVDLLFGLNPSINIVFTVSPVRHLRDGFINNNRSKAHLINAMHEVVGQNNKLHYFPSYELIMDDLRDYRFYKEDLIHPTDQAIEYVWTYFGKTYFDEKTKELNRRVNKVVKFLKHKPFDSNGLDYQNTLLKIKRDIEDLEMEEGLNLSDEKMFCKAKSTKNV